MKTFSQHLLCLEPPGVGGCSFGILTVRLRQEAVLKVGIKTEMTSGAQQLCQVVAFFDALPFPLVEGWVAFVCHWVDRSSSSQLSPPLCTNYPVSLG